jgi:hypothetical protein
VGVKQSRLQTDGTVDTSGIGGLPGAGRQVATGAPVGGAGPLARLLYAPDDADTRYDESAENTQSHTQRAWPAGAQVGERH